MRILPYFVDKDGTPTVDSPFAFNSKVWETPKINITELFPNAKVGAGFVGKAYVPTKPEYWVSYSWGADVMDISISWDGNDARVHVEYRGTDLPADFPKFIDITATLRDKDNELKLIQRTMRFYLTH